MIVWNGRPIFLLLARLELARIWNARGELEAALIELDRARAALPANVESPLVDRVERLPGPVILAEQRRHRQRARELIEQLPAGRRRSVAEIRCHLAEKNPVGARRYSTSSPVEMRPPRDALEHALLDARIALEAGRPRPRREAGARARSRTIGRASSARSPTKDRRSRAPLAAALRRRPADAYSDALAPVLERTIAAAPATNVPLFGGVMLSERELTVLKYLATRLTTREIAAELYVSMNTFRTHTKSIYRKLGVDSRAGAVEAARGLGNPLTGLCGARCESVGRVGEHPGFAGELELLAEVAEAVAREGRLADGAGGGAALQPEHRRELTEVVAGLDAGDIVFGAVVAGAQDLDLAALHDVHEVAAIALAETPRHRRRARSSPVHEARCRRAA